MKYVDLDATITLPGGVIDGVIDPSTYLKRLPDFAEELPPGARAFATDPLHYDFYGPRCMKDLALERISFTGNTVELAFRHNCWKHQEDLTIHYEGVSDIKLDSAALPNVVILDEILPHPHGCTHEIALRPGTIILTCQDLTVTWTETHCPEDPASGVSRGPEHGIPPLSSP
ncbi:hypothetical protein [Streptosporangium saharense]|uniref:Uncharacterized protein n=1 Tax=Streptosporangium saharense TaxID=1706840 RepID=A0A7W7QUU3_9ACTN|nr:hypothetical protein [Streptosporangium saharense]MBB4920166.1 hypothetical protein [Streptosporangium saharense]